MIAGTDAPNTASLRVIEKLGMKYLGNINPKAHGSTVLCALQGGLLCGDDGGLTYESRPQPERFFFWQALAPALQVAS